MSLIITITMPESGGKIIATDDDEQHFVVPFTSPQVVWNTPLTCGEEYPFVDNAEHIAIGVV